MPFRLLRAKQDDECKIHGSGTRAANRTLLSLVLASLLLIVWHVWVYGPSSPAAGPGLVEKPFPVILGSEIWDLLFNRHGILAELWDILPYFVVGLFLAALIRTYKLAIRLRRSLVRYGFFSIFLASLVGVLTPLCACGILTTAVSLLFAGLPMAPVMALLVSSPLISPSAYLLTLSDLGPQWTVIRTLAAFLMGIMAGVVTHLLRNRGFQTENLFIEGSIPRGDFHDENYPREDLRCSCNQKLGNRVAMRTGNNFLVFLAKSAEMIWPIGKYVLVGVAFGSIIERYIPSSWIYNLFGRDSALNVVWITFGAVPIFLHQISASSILHHIKSSLDGTLNGGAGMAFLIGGPVTAIPTMTMLWALFRKRLFFLYMAICIFGTIFLAYTFQYIVFVPRVDTDNPILRGVASVSGGSSAVISKSDRSVRIVMDPGGNNLIAAYSDPVEGRGAAVFDAGPERFMNGSADRYDNEKYVRNIASWLEEYNGSLQEKNILIYDLSGGRDPGRDSFSLRAVDALKTRDGFGVTLTGRNESPEITEGLLQDFSQLWLVSGEAAAERVFSEAELQVIAGFSDDGRGMLIVEGNHRDGSRDNSAANQVASRFGVKYGGSVQNAEELPVSSSFYFLARMAEILEKIYRFVS